MTKRLSIIVIALAMLIALTGVVMSADCDTQTFEPLGFDANLGSVSNSVISTTLAQCDGAMFTRYSYVDGTSNGRMKAPLAVNQTMFQTGYVESTFATGGLTTYSNNITSNVPTVAGQITNFASDRNILFESDGNGVISTEETVFTAEYGTFPMNGSKAALGSGGSVTGNHLAMFTSNFVADNLAVSSQNNVMSGSIAIPSPLIGAYPDLITLDSNIAAQGHSFGFSTVHAYSFDQTGLGNSTVVGTEDTYSDSITLHGNFMLEKQFNWKLKAVPTIQQFNPPTPMCSFD
jgi:hypothetical protein